ncbi:hypothetical protein [Stenotrophomonas sp. SORGH_AS_0321]|uniref:hypothetical protein n=1 Tax=Stenotrophomonas sp. SORGH_AS_0321 TaxID=3041787 RepID=UPI00285BDCA9|nr:hypothetical protein [Stenotrophomonas sp. SORGH_AS_0321]MDR6096344.1 hypothetical protein [Stenotrophomonas sp. SORGH_AS_0321]
MKIYRKVAIVGAILMTQNASLVAANEVVGVTSQVDQLRALERLDRLASEVKLERRTLFASHGQRDPDLSSDESRFNMEGRVDLGKETIGNLTITTSAGPGLGGESNLVINVAGGCLERQLTKDHFAPVKIYWASPGGSAEPLIGFKRVADGHDVILFFDAFGQGCLRAIRSEARSS